MCAVEIKPRWRCSREREGKKRTRTRANETFERNGWIFCRVPRSRRVSVGLEIISKIECRAVVCPGAVVFKVLLSISLSLFFFAHPFLSLLSSNHITVRVKDRFSVPTRTRVKARRSTEPWTLPKDTGTSKAS